MNKWLLGIAAVLYCTSSAFAAPHISKLKPEPVERPGTHFSQRLLAKSAAALFTSKALTSTVNVLFLRVQFQQETTDDPTTTGDGTWADSAYGGDTWVDSARVRFVNYWNEVSYGNFGVNVIVSPNIYTLSRSMSGYGSDYNYANVENLIYESITGADGDIDFTQYAAILIVHAGAGEESDITGDTPNDVWSQYYADSCISLNNTGTTCLTVDSKQITDVIIMPQTDSQDGIVVDPLGVYAHEFGHWLGLPDLYCTATFPPCFLDGVGVWSLMGDGLYNSDPATCVTDESGTTCTYGSLPAHLDPWSKVYLGWVTPLMLSSTPDPGDMILNNVEQNRDILKVQASSSAPSQYFLIENRQRTGFDGGLPGSGLLVWLIDDEIVNLYIAFNTVNNKRFRPGVKVIEADGDDALLSYGSDIGSAGDPFPGSENNTSLTPLTTPSSLPYTPSGWTNIKNINEESGVINFSIGFAPSPPQNLSGSLQSPDAVLSWTANTEADLQHYNVYKDDVLLASTADITYTDAGAGGGHFYKITAVDDLENESAYSQTVAVQAPSGGGGGGCFIATAAYGSYLADEVMVLRRFRDRYLLTNSPGRSLVKMYYRYSPPAAAFITRHETLRTATRFALTPVVYSIKYPAAALCELLAFFVLAGSRTIKKGRLAPSSS